MIPYLSDHWVLEQASASLPDAWLSGEDTMFLAALAALYLTLVSD